MLLGEIVPPVGLRNLRFLDITHSAFDMAENIVVDGDDVGFVDLERIARSWMSAMPRLECLHLSMASSINDGGDISWIDGESYYWRRCGRVNDEIQLTSQEEFLEMEKLIKHETG